MCGAGGGGCLLTLASEGARPAVERALAEAGGQILPFRFARRGVRVEADSRDSGIATRDTGIGTRDTGIGTRDTGIGTRDTGIGTRDTGGKQ